MIQRHEIEEYHGRIPSEGWACDIDNTIAATAPGLFERLDARYPRLPEDRDLSLIGLIKKYGYTVNIPQWNTPDARAWQEEVLKDPEFYGTLPSIEGAADVLARFRERMPFTTFITARPETTVEATERWLGDRFPRLPIIAKPSRLDVSKNNEWKARVLEALYPRVKGIIDDDPRLVRELSPDYRGVIILYGQEEVPHDHVEAYACLTWKDVEEKLEELASLKVSST
jgi:5'(3')-deoxyribonucleotidase